MYVAAAGGEGRCPPPLASGAEPSPCGFKRRLPPTTPPCAQPPGLSPAPLATPPRVEAYGWAAVIFQSTTKPGTRMAIAEGRTIPFVGPEAIDAAVLETFEYAGPDQNIVTETREFSAVCPYSGLPDFATLTIRYTPSDRCVELKSLKYYVTSYRNVGIFQEHATARIAEDLFKLLEPQMLEVSTLYNVRGGFETRCTVRLPKV